MKHKALKITAIALALLVCLSCGGIHWYLSHCYSPDEAAAAALQSSAAVTVEKGNGSLIFRPEDYDTGLIFYPGGSVEFEAYAPLLHTLAEEGILTIVVEMPLHLAVLDKNAAEGIPQRFEEVEHWYIGGHSLGGSMAASYAARNSGFDGLLLLAAYSIEDLTQSGLSVLSLYGTEDTVLNQERYAENYVNLPETTTEMLIDGGNHAQFGSYGNQKGDGSARISPAEQVKITADAVAVWMGIAS